MRHEVSIDLFLIRHGDAEPPSSLPDAHRALTARGRRDVRSATRLLASQAERVDCILTSPLVRAVQTAEILAAEVALDEPIWARGGLVDPVSLDDLSTLIDELPDQPRGIALVGHEPTLSDYAAHLLERPSFPLPFKKAMILALAFDPSRRAARFKWIILPDGPAGALRVDTLSSL